MKEYAYEVLLHGVQFHLRVHGPTVAMHSLSTWRESGLDFIVNRNNLWTSECAIFRTCHSRCVAASPIAPQVYMGPSVHRQKVVIPGKLSQQIWAGLVKNGVAGLS